MSAAGTSSMHAIHVTVSAADDDEASALTLALALARELALLPSASIDDEDAESSACDSSG